jgi:hypothetical protein
MHRRVGVSVWPGAVLFASKAPITARSGSRQGPGPQDFQDTLAVQSFRAREVCMSAGGAGQRILEPLTGPVEG